MKLIQQGNICVFKIVAAEQQEGIFVLLTDFPTELALLSFFFSSVRSWNKISESRID